MPDLVTLATTRMTDDLLGWFAETTLVASALAALAGLVAKARRLAPGPAARHALWLLVMIKLVMPPLVHWPWSVPSPVAATRPDSRRLQDHPIRAVAEVPVADSSARNGPGLKTIAPILALPRNLDAISPSRDLRCWVAMAWLCGSIVIAIEQGRRVCRFRRLLIEATPAPGWLVEEAGQIGLRLGVRVPSILIVPGLGTPVLWCLGRPILLVPTKLLETLEARRWRSIVAHELAHLRRGDHWVRRLELAAGLAWWWNPLYWLARSRLDFEAELACDAWAVWASPADRLTYAESLIRICTALSPASSPAPALGVAGAGRSFERRLTMILRDRVDRRVSAPGLLAACLLAALALPSWTLAGPPRAEDAPAAFATIKLGLATPVEVVDDDDDAADETAREGAAKLKAERAKLQKRMGELDKEMEGKFGPGSDFAKKMEAMGREMEGKFGPGSDFAKKMEAMGREMEGKFGPGSDFAKKMEKNFGPDSAFAKQMNDAMKQGNLGDPKAWSKKAKLKAESEKAVPKAEVRAKVEGRAKAKPTSDKRARRIEVLESRIDELTEELKKLKAESGSDKEEDGQG